MHGQQPLFVPSSQTCQCARHKTRSGVLRCLLAESILPWVDAVCGRPTRKDVDQVALVRNHDFVRASIDDSLAVQSLQSQSMASWRRSGQHVRRCSQVFLTLLKFATLLTSALNRVVQTALETSSQVNGFCDYLWWRP